jgi:hypothetical protein
MNYGFRHIVAVGMLPSSAGYAAKTDIHRPFENVDDPKDAIL